MLNYLKTTWVPWATILLSTFVMAMVVINARKDGYKNGYNAAEAKYLKQINEHKQQDENQLLTWTAHLDYIEQQRREAVKRAEEIPVKIVKEYLPGKEVIKHEIREVPVYSECRISASVFDQLTAALSGRPAATGVPSS